MSAELIGPTVMIVLSVGSSVVYLVKGDLAHSLYWLSGAILNAAITFNMPKLPWFH